MRDRFRSFAHWTAEVVGSPWAFALGVAVILIWAVTGPLFHFSDTWQLIINTGGVSP
jgi:low affinity Fe/Cu permease